MARVVFMKVVIPWRDSDDSHRQMSFVNNYWQWNDWGFDIALADSGAEPFSRSASRNVGVAAAGMGVVVIADADTLPEYEPLRAAIAAADDRRLHLPYDRYVNVKHGRVIDRTENSTGGCLVIHSDAYALVGGHDERFIGWGAEDIAFRVACDRKLGETVRHPGVLTHQWHPIKWSPHDENYRANFQRLREVYGQ